jgi:hypothetical protein
VASSEQDSAARGAGTEASRDHDDDAAESDEWATHRRRSESTVVLSDSSDDDKTALPDQSTGGDADASSSRDLEEEGRLAHFEAERRSKFNAKRASRQPEAATPHGKGPAGESSTPPPPTSALPGKSGWVERDAS